ncbi:MAG: PqiC family protein [Candidatus Cloacimonetes bacterium]|nr:PqiC family protein [Candidatus Cloacimonadota bacterium]
MKKSFIFGLSLLVLLMTGCFAKVDKAATNYYVLDYQSSTEVSDLVMQNNNGKALHVMNGRVNRTYNRNQIVVKESFYQVRFLADELWANRLSDAIPAIISQRLRAYNIFSSVSCEATEKDPDYYLETNILNLEKIEGKQPRAFLRIEFILRDSSGEKTIVAHSAERYSQLIDNSTVYFVQVINNMIMEETNTFAAKYIAQSAGRPFVSSRDDAARRLSAPERYLTEQLENEETHPSFGELLLRTKANVNTEMKYSIEALDSLNTVIATYTAEFNEPIQLLTGRYRVIVGHNEDISMILDVHPMQRTVVPRDWSELRVRILDLSQDRVRQNYDIWSRNEDVLGYDRVGQDFSISDEEHGIDEKLWILPPGNYMVTLSGYSWSDLKDFTTVCLNHGDSHVLTIIVDPSSSSGTIFVGAGILADEMDIGGSKFHKGVIHANVNISSNNETKQDEPTYSLNLNGTLENTIDHEFKPFHYNLRSIYDVGANFSKNNDFRINLDGYSMKNTFLLYPWSKGKKLLNNFAVYARADLNTHFFDEYTYFDKDYNIILLDRDNNELETILNQDKLRTKVALSPIKLKEGGGLTYRLNLGPNSTVSLRGGYGWQQDLSSRAFSHKESKTVDGVPYEVYMELPNKYDRGIEATLILSAGNIFKLFSLNSSVDALFPIGDVGVMPRIENENRLNFRIYRNVSLDFRLNLHYDESSNQDWWVYDYSAYLRMSLFY